MTRVWVCNNPECKSPVKFPYVESVVSTPVTPLTEVHCILCKQPMTLETNETSDYDK